MEKPRSWRTNKHIGSFPLGLLVIAMAGCQAGPPHAHSNATSKPAVTAATASAAPMTSAPLPKVANKKWSLYPNGGNPERPIRDSALTEPWRGFRDRCRNTVKASGVVVSDYQLINLRTDREGFFWLYWIPKPPPPGPDGAVTISTSHFACKISSTDDSLHILGEG